MQPQYLDRTAAAQYLSERGIQLKPETLARWQSTGRYSIPVIKIGRIVRYDRADLDRFISEHRVDPRAA